MRRAITLSGMSLDTSSIEDAAQRASERAATAARQIREQQGSEDTSARASSGDSGLLYLGVAAAAILAALVIK